MNFILNDLFAKKLSVDELVEWLSGQKEHLPDDCDLSRYEFIPLFLNFLRDQASHFLHSNSANGLTPNKCINGSRVLKYVSPHKLCRNNTNVGGLSKRRTLFLDSLPKHDQLSKHIKSPSDADSILSHCSVLLDNFQSRDKSHDNVYKCSEKYSKISPGNGCPEILYSEKLQYKKCKGNEYLSLQSSERKGHVENKFREYSLSDFITPEVKKLYKKKSPVVGSKNFDAHLSGSKSNASYDLDINDLNAFPPVGEQAFSEKKRRIKPTRIAANVSPAASVFLGSSKSSVSSPFTNCHEESKNSVQEEREILKRELLEKQNIFSDTLSGFGVSHSTEKVEFVQPSIEHVTNKEELNILVNIYSEIIFLNMVPSIMVELYFVFQLLVLCVTSDVVVPEGSNLYLLSVHNCVYFSCEFLLTVTDLLRLLDRATLKLIYENSRVQQFCPELCILLHDICIGMKDKRALSAHSGKAPVVGVSFQDETDNNTNFPSSISFHVFCKQRDQFYEILRIWEGIHTTPGWSFMQSLGPRIKSLLALRDDPLNYAHFARLFVSQLLNSCIGEEIALNLHDESEGCCLLKALKEKHPEKYKRLYERLITPAKIGGPCPLPSFCGSQEFFKNFIVAASNFTFNKHLSDVLVYQILLLNNQEFFVTETETKEGPNEQVYAEAWSIVQNLRLLAKFLGFVEFLPYQTTEHLSEVVLASQISLRNKAVSVINMSEVLRCSALAGKLVITIPWLIEFLSMVDLVALHTVHYMTVVFTLFYIFKLLYFQDIDYNSFCQKCLLKSNKLLITSSNGLFLHFILGWFFDLPAFPEGLFHAEIHDANIDISEFSKNVTVISQKYFKLCTNCCRNNFYANKKKLAPGKDEDIFVSSTPSRNSVKTFFDSPSKANGLASFSPLKTPSKFLRVSIIESPQTTPQGKTEENDEDTLELTNLSIDQCNFIDHQMLLVCCPQVIELRNVLFEFSIGMNSRSSNSFRKITPLSAPEKSSLSTPGKSVQLHLEDNFFHNQSSSVRKTVEFVTERTTSYITRAARSNVLTTLREDAREKLKSAIGEKLCKSSVQNDFIHDFIRKKSIEFSQDLIIDLKDGCLSLEKEAIQNCALPALSLLLPPDMSSQSIKVCEKIVTRMVSQRVTSWFQSHFIASLFTKDLITDSERILRQAYRLSGTSQAADSIVSPNKEVIKNLSNDANRTNEVMDSSLQNESFSGFPSNISMIVKTIPVIACTHDSSAFSPSHLITKIKNIISDILFGTYEQNQLKEADIHSLLFDVSNSFNNRQDLILYAYKAIDCLVVDLCITVVICAPEIASEDLLNAFADLWRSVSNGGVLPNPSKLCNILGSDTLYLLETFPINHQNKAWHAVEMLLQSLIARDIMTLPDLQDQCIILLRHGWSEATLSSLSACITTVCKSVGTPQKELLDWISWLCKQMENFNCD